MKKYFLILLSVMMITSCSNGLENQAKEQLKKTMKEMLKNPDSATLTNVKTQLNNDSLCIIHFTCKAQNGFGGYTSKRYEYIFLKAKNKDKTSYFKEGVFDLGDTKSVITDADKFLKDVSDITKKDLKKDKSAAEVEEDSINAIYLMAITNLLFKGRIVEEDDGEEIKL